MIYLIFFVALINLILLFFVGIFLVRMQDRFNSMIADLAEIIENFLYIPQPMVDKNIKTWDEKFEDQVEKNRLRAGLDSGLKDLEKPTISWGQPPAPNDKNTEGLIVKNNENQKI